jgi:hypothetical protein
MIRSTLKFKKSTPGTHVYENRDDLYVKTLYISRGTFNGKTPNSIVVTIEDGDKPTEKDIT